MRYRLLASYQGAPYEAGVGPTESDVVLFAACPPPEELRFEPATGHWRKQVLLADVQTLHESRPVGFFRGEPCIVLDDLNDRLHIAYLGHDAYRAEQLGYWEVDRGVFELIAPRQEVADIVEQRLAFPHREDGTWQTAATDPQIAYGGPDAPGDVLPTPGMAEDEPGSPDVAPGYSPEPPPGDFSGGDRGQALSATGFGGSPDAGPAGDGFAPATNLGASSEPDSAADLIATPNYLTATAVPGVAMPMIDEPPLPLEAQALRAATAAHRREQPETRAGQIPAEQIPAEHIPAAHIPAEQNPAEQPAPSAPTAAIAPAQDTPQVATGPIQDGQAATVQPVQSSPASEVPVSDAPVSEVPVSEVPVSEAPVSDAPVSDIPAGAQEPLAPASPISPGPAALQPPGDEADSQLATVPRRRRAAKRRLPTQRIFSDLARQAAIPATAYAVGEDVDGAMCLMRTADGFEVFNSAAGARHEVRIFQDEESAYFYLFGVLVAEAVRTGALTPHQ